MARPRRTKQDGEQRKTQRRPPPAAAAKVAAKPDHDDDDSSDDGESVNNNKDEILDEASFGMMSTMVQGQTGVHTTIPTYGTPKQPSPNQIAKRTGDRPDDMIPNPKGNSL